jgi:hypothetical protein
LTTLLRGVAVATRWVLVSLRDGYVAAGVVDLPDRAPDGHAEHVGGGLRVLSAPGLH